MAGEVTIMQPQQAGGAIVDFDSSTAQGMAARLADMKQRLELVQRFFQEIMVKDVDFGVIPGTNKPTLLKPGAEKLCELYGFTITIAQKNEEKDIATGYYRAEFIIRLIHRGTGVVVAEGTGEANAYESRYRWRWVGERDLPRGIDKDSLLSKEKEGPYGKYFTYRVENDDLFGIWNTVLKMAKKRALVDAVLSATRSSGIFSQAEDDFEAWIEGEDEPKSKSNKGAGAGPKSNKSTQAPKCAAANIVVTFGKEKGRTLGDLYENNRGYFDWLMKNNDRMRPQCEELVRVANTPTSNPEQPLGNANSADSAPNLTDDDVPPGLFGGGQ